MGEPADLDDLDAFRLATRAWLQDNCPPAMRMAGPEDEDVWGGSRGVFKHPDSKPWFDAMVARGWTAPTWPVEYGGAGLGTAEARVLDDELKAMGCRIPLKSLGIWLLGPALLEFGSDEQKARFLPGIASGETRWCQGYSEPGAGSDLAGLQTKCVRDGDHYVVDGQKVWTSHADKADWCFCLVRTDPNAPKRDGISFLLLDMTTPGVSVRPIELISGASPFCETFLEGVRVPVENRIGEENRGWTVAKTVLVHERTLISKLRDRAPEQTESLEDIARRHLGTDSRGRIADPIMRDRITQANMDFECNRLLLKRIQDGREAGKAPGAEALTLKLYGTELAQRIKVLKVELLGYDGLGWEEGGFAAGDVKLTREWLRSRANTIEGGSSEIQRNILAKRGLGLPD